MSEIGALVDAVGWPGATLILLIVALVYAVRKIDKLGVPFVKSQIEFTNSQKASMESQAKSIEMQAHSVKAIENTLKMMAVGISQILDAGDGISKEKFKDLEYKFMRLEEHAEAQDKALGLVPKQKAESITDPKLRMEPMQTHSEKADMEADLQSMKEEIKEDAKQPDADQ